MVHQTLRNSSKGEVPPCTIEILLDIDGEEGIDHGDLHWIGDVMKHAFAELPLEMARTIVCDAKLRAGKATPWLGMYVHLEKDYHCVAAVDPKTRNVIVALQRMRQLEAISSCGSLPQHAQFDPRIALFHELIHLVQFAQGHHLTDASIVRTHEIVEDEADRIGESLGMPTNAIRAWMQAGFPDMTD